MKTGMIGLVGGFVMATQAALADDSFEARHNGLEPAVSIDISAIYMTRSAPASRGLFTTNGGAATFNANQLGFDWRAGLDASLALRLAQRWNLEFRGLFPGDFRSSMNVTAIGGAFLTTPVTGYGTPALAITYESAMRSGEANVRYRLNDTWQFLGGARFINLAEDIYTITPVAPPVFAVGWGARNMLSGGQIGVEGAWTSGKFSVDAALKAGLFNNHINTSAFAEQPIGNALGTATGSFNRIAYSIEGAIAARYKLTQNASVSAGYQLLYLDNVALASDQLSQAPNLIGGAQSMGGVALGGVLYHGLTVGLSVQF